MSTPPRSRPPLRWLRGVVAGVWCGAGAVVAHQLAGGRADTLIALTVIPFAIGLCLLLLRGRPDPIRVAAIALLSQVAVHGLLLVAGPGRDVSAHSMGVTDHSMGVTDHSAGVIDHSAGMSDHSAGGLSMLLGHLLVAAVTTAACTRLDRALVELTRGAADAFVRRLRMPRRVAVLILAAPREAPAAPLLREGRVVSAPAAPRGPPMSLIQPIPA